MLLHVACHHGYGVLELEQACRTIVVVPETPLLQKNHDLRIVVIPQSVFSGLVSSEFSLVLAISVPGSELIHVQNLFLLWINPGIDFIAFRRVYLVHGRVGVFPVIIVFLSAVAVPVRHRSLLAARHVSEQEVDAALGADILQDLTNGLVAALHVLHRDCGL
ncbi:hypothetical protein CCHR01_07181 [Colletotrichum chrysophilum]|uniref:Uncharacterized protein n=1 Tax=Colletotrichum chrysophilum TaxID=1836956 RepID=A0AAD9EJ25_9PEZI|nr:hypothetical protein CCHR01_07181 [Colletotrichum chrysophilum]